MAGLMNLRNSALLTVSRLLPGKCSATTYMYIHVYTCIYMYVVYIHVLMRDEEGGKQAWSYTCTGLYIQMSYEFTSSLG